MMVVVRPSAVKAGETLDMAMGVLCPDVDELRTVGFAAILVTVLMVVMLDRMLLLLLLTLELAWERPSRNLRWL